jgi:hypothetical protein
MALASLLPGIFHGFSYKQPCGHLLAFKFIVNVGSKIVFNIISRTVSGCWGERSFSR